MESQPEQISYSWAFQVLHHLRPDSEFAVYLRRSRLRQRLFELFDCLDLVDFRKKSTCSVLFYGEFFFAEFSLEGFRLHLRS